MTSFSSTFSPSRRTTKSMGWPWCRLISRDTSLYRYTRSPIDGIKNISGLDSLAVPLLKLRRGPGGRRDQKSLGTAIHRQNDEEPRQEIHKGAGGKITTFFQKP